jgi:hypothetical protein
MSIVTLSFVITGCDGKLSTCSRRSMRASSPVIFLRPGDVALEEAHVERLGAFDERDQDVEAGACEAIEAPEALDDHDLGLTDDADEARRHGSADHQDNDLHGAPTG